MSMNLFNGNKEARKRRVRVISLDRDNVWRKRWGKYDGTDSVDAQGRTYVVGRSALQTNWPTIFNDLGFTRGTYPCVIVWEECSVPITLAKEQQAVTIETKINGFQQQTLVHRAGCVHDPSAEVHGFKKMTLARQIVRAAQKDSPTDVVKWLAAAAVAIAGLVLLALLYMMNSVGVIDFGSAKNAIGLALPLAL